MMLERFFDLKQNGTSIKTEILAGLTTFMTMAYIIAVNPSILTLTGMPKDAVMTATILISGFATLFVALYAKLPFAVAPGMGINAFFTFTVCMGMGKDWHFALTATFLTGVVFFILTFFDLKRYLLDTIPDNLKKAIGVGIGLFITIVGLSSVGLIVKGSEGAPLVALGNIKDPSVFLTIIGIIISAVLVHFNITGALAIGIAIITVLGIPFGVTNVENFKVISMPASIEPIFFKLNFDEIFSLDMAIVVFINLFVIVFDSLGSLIGLASKANLLDENGNVKNFKRVLRVDALSAVGSGILGTSSTTVYIESASGIANGGRTSLTSITVAMLFFLSLFLSPLFLIVPAAATSPALVIVGVFMLGLIKDINFTDMEEAMPAFLTIVVMPFTYSIYNGVAIGIISYTAIKILNGKIKKLPLFTIVLSLIFMIKYIM